jgi:hypothetical protein
MHKDLALLFEQCGPTDRMAKLDADVIAPSANEFP